MSSDQVAGYLAWFDLHTSSRYELGIQYRNERHCVRSGSVSCEHWYWHLSESKNNPKKVLRVKGGRKVA